MKISIVGVLVEECSLQSFWTVFREVLLDNINFLSDYEMSIDGRRKALSFKEIDDYLLADNLKKAMMITACDFSQGHHFQYAEINGEFRVGVPIHSMKSGYQMFIDCLSCRFDFSNSISTDLQYVSSQLSCLDPPNSNLYLAPGLSNVRGKYIEGVAADMWFGEGFWQYAACTKEELLAQDWLSFRHLENGTVHVNAWTEPFSTDEGEQGVIQRRLLKLLFNIDEQNPCGAVPAEEPASFTQEVSVNEEGEIIADSGLKEKE